MEHDGTHERRRQSGVAVISLRRTWLTQRLHLSGVSFRHIVPQLGPRLLPDFRPPLLLDAAQMPLSMLVTILWELTRLRDMTPTLVLIPADMLGLAPLVTLPLAVNVLLADTVSATSLASWLRMAPQFARRIRETPPAWVDIEPVQVGSLPDCALDVLHALAPYGVPAPADITVAAAQAGMSRRLFCYQLAALRSITGVSPARRYRPPALAAAICTALTAPIAYTQHVVRA